MSFVITIKWFTRRKIITLTLCCLFFRIFHFILISFIFFFLCYSFMNHITYEYFLSILSKIISPERFFTGNHLSYVICVLISWLKWMTWQRQLNMAMLNVQKQWFWWFLKILLDKFEFKTHASSMQQATCLKW